MCACEYDVANFQRAVLHEHCGHISASFVKTRLNYRTHRKTVGVGLQVEKLCLKQHFLHKFVHTDAFLGRYVLALVFAAPFLHKIVHVGELFLDFVGICSGLVNLVDGKHHRHSGRRSMVDGLYCLRHHIVVGSYYDDCKVSNLGTSGTHGGECLMARSVEECYAAPVRQFHVICAYMLRYATCLAGNNIGFSDIVEKRGLAMVDMSHDCHNRRTRQEIFLAVFLRGYCLCHVGAHIFCRESELFGHNVDCLRVKTLIDGNHHAKIHAGGNDIVHRHFHKVCKVVGSHKLRELYHSAFSLLTALVFKFTVMDGLFFLFTPFQALLGSLVCEASKSLLNLLLHIFLACLRLLRTLIASPVLTVASLAVATLAVAAATLPGL